jgi:cytoskeletal protein RodZ
MATLSDRSSDEQPSRAHLPDYSGAGAGERLRRARERLGLTLEQVSQETKIARRDLAALEHDDPDVGVGDFYRRSKLRAYARAVNLDQSLVLPEQFRATSPVPQELEPTPSRPRASTAAVMLMAAAVIGTVMGGGAPAIEGDARVRTIEAPRSVQETPSGAGISTASPQQHVTLAAPVSNDSPTRIEPGDVRAPEALDHELAATAGEDQVRESSSAITELIVTTQPAGARVTVNGIGWGITPVTIRYLPRGPKRIRVSKEGYATAERPVRLEEGQPTKIDIELVAAP